MTDLLILGWTRALMMNWGRSTCFNGAVDVTSPNTCRKMMNLLFVPQRGLQYIFISAGCCKCHLMKNIRAYDKCMGCRGETEPFNEARLIGQCFTASHQTPAIASLKPCSDSRETISQSGPPEDEWHASAPAGVYITSFRHGIYCRMKLQKKKAL